MGSVSFLLPSGLPPDLLEDLKFSCLVGGYERMQVPTRVKLHRDVLSLYKDQEDSGYLLAPMDIAGAGRLMGMTATLTERPANYHFLIELARGKVNQVRNQIAAFASEGMLIPPDVDAHIRKATKEFGAAILDSGTLASHEPARAALSDAYLAADLLIKAYMNQAFEYLRQSSSPREPIYACRLTEVPPKHLEKEFLATFNTVCLPLGWGTIEPTETNYLWDQADEVAAWAEKNNLAMIAGPLVDFSDRGIPTWLRSWEGDLPSLAGFMCDYIETVISRYRLRIQTWTVCTGSNCTTSLGLSEEDMIRLTARLAEAAWGIDSALQVSIGVGQPWGDYLNDPRFQYSPFVFCDTLARAGLPFASFELELHAGTIPYGSFCRDLLETTRLFDTYAILGVPLQLSMSYPSSPGADTQAEPSVLVAHRGYWRGIDPLSQASWAESFAALSLTKPRTLGMIWDHFRDSRPHRFPNAGLVDAQEQPKPAFEALRSLRQKHLP